MRERRKEMEKGGGRESGKIEIECKSKKKLERERERERESSGEWLIRRIE